MKVPDYHKLTTYARVRIAKFKEIRGTKLFATKDLEKAAVYNPFNLTGDKYKLVVKKLPLGTYLALRSHRFSLDFHIKGGGYIPRTGLILAESLDIKEGETVLDIGTGQTCFPALYAAAAGARKVDAVEIVPEDAKWAEYNVGLNNLKKKVKVFIGNLFEPVQGRKYDRIISNPPFMPMPRPGSLHDYGGVDGWDVLNAIITEAPKYLNPGGEVRLVFFEFLGADQRFGNILSAKERFKRIGFKNFKVITKVMKQLSKEGLEYENLPHVLKLYAECPFFRKDGNPYSSKEDIETILQKEEKVFWRLVVVAANVK